MLVYIAFLDPKQNEQGNNNVEYYIGNEKGVKQH